MSAQSVAKFDARSTKDGPWCWQSKAALALIRSSAKSHHQHALTVYLVLAEAASNQQSETFVLSTGRCAKLAFVGKKTVRAAIRELVRLHLVTVTRERTADGMKNLPCRFTLLAVNTGPQQPAAESKIPRKSPTKAALNW